MRSNPVLARTGKTSARRSKPSTAHYLETEPHGAAAPWPVLTVGTTYYIDSLNPFVAFDAQAVNAFVMLFPQLVQYGPGLKLQGDWASSWEHSPDGLTWTFHLRSGGKWSDGAALTAADAVWTINTEPHSGQLCEAAAATLRAPVTSTWPSRLPSRYTVIPLQPCWYAS